MKQKKLSYWPYLERVLGLELLAGLVEEYLDNVRLDVRAVLNGNPNGCELLRPGLVINSILFC